MKLHSKRVYSVFFTRNECSFSSFKEANSKSQAGKLDTSCVVFQIEGLSIDYSLENSDIVDAFKKYTQNE
jgi:hypothetical protein